MQRISDDPGKVREALSSENSSEWKTARKEEIVSLIANKTWVLSDLPPGTKTMGIQDERR